MGGGEETLMVSFCRKFSLSKQGVLQVCADKINACSGRRDQVPRLAALRFSAQKSEPLASESSR